MCTNDRDFPQWLKKLCRDIEIIEAAHTRQGWALLIVRNRLAAVAKQKRQEQAKLDEAQRRESRSRNRKAATKTARASRSHAARSSNVLYVEQGVHNVIIEHDREGSMSVHVDNIGLSVPLKYRQRLRQLLLALGGKVSRVNTSESGIIPFKTKAELIEAIEELSGQRITVNNLQNLIRQLRDLFAQAQINPNIIETGGNGYRLRIRIRGRIFENVT